MPEVLDVFLSYSHDDVDRATQLRTQLWNHDHSVYMDKQLTPGKLWPEELQQRLDSVRCVVALWSKASAGSNVQFDEANFALSRGMLVLARLDDSELPLGLRPVQHIELSDWTRGEDHPGIARLYGRVHELIEAYNARPEPIGEIARELAGKPDSADRHSVSNRNADEVAILATIEDADRHIKDLIREAYRQMALALEAARLTLDDEAPRTHYEKAADAFRQVDLHLSPAHKARHPSGLTMPVGYFLELEFANALAFSVRETEPVPKEALDIYERLAEQHPADTAVFLRSGRARVKAARHAPPGNAKRDTLQAAIRDLNKALSCAPFDGLVDPNHWVYFEAPLQIGICFWLISEFPDVPIEKRVESLKTAISHTEAATNRKKPDSDPDDFVKFITLRAAGNIVFYASSLMKSGIRTPEIEQAIDRYTQYLLDDGSWAIAKNQPRIIDSIMSGATANADWPLALRMARLNAENLTKISYERSLQPEEREMRAIAQQTADLIQKLGAPREGSGPAKTDGWWSRRWSKK
jgi:tetratricopeptide (TPR) repeat protein